MAITRRRLLASTVAGIAGAAGLGVAARFASRYGLVPPDSGGIYGPGRTLTYAAQRIVAAPQSLAREFDRSMISAIAPVNGPAPLNDAYQQVAANSFANWRLSVAGLVSRPAMLSLDDLKRLPQRSQLTMHTCEEGWSFIAEWTGVALADVLRAAGVGPDARYVVFYPFDEWWDSLDLDEALHPQTLLAYGMNGEPLSLDHGAPVRVRVPRQLGYKSVKFLSRITVVDSLKPIGSGIGSASAEAGYAWYAGI